MKTYLFSGIILVVMEIEQIKRTVYWISFFILSVFLALFMVSGRLSLLFRLILLLLLAFLSSMFRLEDRFSFIQIVLVVICGLVIGGVLSSDSAQFWPMSLLYMMIFYLGCEVFERNLLGV